LTESRRDNAYGARRLGFGVSGPHGTIGVHPETTVRMIQHAYAMGVRVFDTGPAYGSGEAERRLGEALARIPTYDPIVSTKAGVTSSGFRQRHRDFSPAAIRRSVEGSLKRLRRSRIDWLFLHGPAPEELTDELLKTLNDMRRRGDVVSLGVCGLGPELDAALKTGEFTHYMTPIHAGLNSEQMQRLWRLRNAGELIGVKTLATARKAITFSAGSTWRLARSILDWNVPRPPTLMSVDEALLWALTDGGAHRVLTTTSSWEHLDHNIAAVANPPSGRLITGGAGLSSSRLSNLPGKPQ
jgi:aryl-alcohol dehydrogenase-like predicted oxidoreductase